MTWAAVMVGMLPALAPADAQEIATLAERYGRAWKVPPALILAIAYRETRWGTRPDHPSSQDHGLMGLRVNKYVRPALLGREHELEDVDTAIWEGAHALWEWRRFHRKKCRDPSHPWWSHYQWGVRVGNSDSGERVRRVLWRLRKARRRGNSRQATGRREG